MKKINDLPKNLCWYMLFEMLEDTNLAKELLLVDKLEDFDIESCKKLINGNIDVVANKENPFEFLAHILIGKRKLLQAKKSFIYEGKNGYYNKVVWALGEILDPDSSTDRPSLSSECAVTDNLYISNDNKKNGYSRGPFFEINEEHENDIALAAISYLYRAHSLIYCRNKGERDFNASKVAINDLFQAHQLASRLYYSLSSCHIKTENGTQEVYFGDVKKGFIFSISPAKSSYFIWSILSIIELKRGIIYRQVDYLDEANKYFRHFQLRFNRLADDPYNITTPHINNDIDKFFLTPSILKAFYERSKVFYEKGLFIESLINLLLCLGHLTRKSMIESVDVFQDDSPENSNKIQSAHEQLLGRLNEVIKFLNVCRRQPVWEIKQITTIFGFVEKIPARIVSDEFLILKNMHHSYLRYVPKVFSRLSLILIMFLQKRNSKDTTEKNMIKIITGFCEIHKKFNKAGIDEILFQPVVSKFCLSIIMTNISSAKKITSKKVIPGYIGVGLTEELRSTLHKKQPIRKNEQDLNEYDFYLAVLEKVTQNLNNLITVPRKLQSFLMREGYKVRRTFGDLSKRTVFQSLQSTFDKNLEPITPPKTKDKLIILRRWQSFNPRIPRPYGDSVKGGGYFLMWYGKGVVIDPGYDFIRNFYEEGFTLNDINAVIITHSHPDHDDDLSTLTTLIVEWNEFHKSMGYEEEGNVRLDLFLNESTHMKFASWLKASGEGIKRIILMPVVIWNMSVIKQREKREKGKNLSIRGKDVIISVLNEYHWELEIVPAWHDDVIGSTSAVGIKLHLFNDNKEKPEEIGLLGYTGDTGLYEYEYSSQSNKSKIMTVADKYKNCDILIAHLGDIRLRELFTKFNAPDKKELSNIGEVVHSYTLALFSTKNGIKLEQIEPAFVEAFYRLLINLRLITNETLENEIFSIKGLNVLNCQSTSKIIYDYIRNKRIFKSEVKNKNNFIIDACIHDLNHFIANEHNHKVKERLNKYLYFIEEMHCNSKQELSIEVCEKAVIFALLGYLATKTLENWDYEYHLGITGIFKLFDAFKKKKSKKNNKIFIVAELPEELQSYRHHIARLLNKTRHNSSVTAFTGDIGMHIGLTKIVKQEDTPERVSDVEHVSIRQFCPRIRCTYCNYNNESVLQDKSYHEPENIRETPLRRFDSALIYLCTFHDHHPRVVDNELVDFLSSPSLRVI